MVKVILALVLSSAALMACSGMSEHPPPAGDRTDAGTFDAGVDASDGGDASDSATDASDAGVDASDAGADADYCNGGYLDVTSLVPNTSPREGGALATLTGCKLSKVIDVEVNVQSVAFTRVSDTTITFIIPPLDEGQDLPFAAQVDVIVKPSDQVQVTLTYQ